MNISRAFYVNRKHVFTTHRTMEYFPMFFYTSYSNKSRIVWRPSMKIYIFVSLLKYVDVFHIFLTSDHNDGHFTSRSTCKTYLLQRKIFRQKLSERIPNIILRPKLNDYTEKEKWFHTVSSHNYRNVVLIGIRFHVGGPMNRVFKTNWNLINIW
jgi:hypothetical protein